MRMLCEYQLKHGAVVHHSKEHINHKSRKLVKSVEPYAVILYFLFPQQSGVTTVAGISMKKQQQTL